MEGFLVPIVGSWVTSSAHAPLIGPVTENLDGGRIRVDFGEKHGRVILSKEEWKCGLMPGFSVQDVPFSAARSSMGVGKVIEVRDIAGRQQASVQFRETGDTLWIPFEQLIRVMDPVLQYRRNQQHQEQASERTAVHLMGRALASWNEATGALSRLDVDPLPHQISLVHRIVSSGKANWIIADDVGLGKTIEVGLLLGALERRNKLRRVLVVSPAGLTTQWREEMQVKFDRFFRIYGRDFEISHEREWSFYDKVIVSLDLVKPRDRNDDGGDLQTRFGNLLSAPSWDIVIFDEAHRLARDEEGRSTLRFNLASALRQRTDEFLMLTGTPHQGDTGKFRNLLRLARPDLEEAIRNFEAEPEIVREIVVRNRKIDAVDIEGNFLFHGLVVRRTEVKISDEARALDRLLTEYLRRGYRAGERRGGAAGRAIGFVMTIYRKLATSSVYALLVALNRRRKRLHGDSIAQGELVDPSTLEDPIEAQSDMLASLDIDESTDPFFDDEVPLLEAVIKQARECLPHDEKVSEIARLVRDHVVEGKHALLVFTEYRATQELLCKVLEKVTGNTPLLIHGGMTVAEKQSAVSAFEEGSNILISTEAGGEGLNLHRNCHVMVNYDLPWNPARLSQRIGRLYRYGQTEKVVVINLLTRDSLDADILSRVVEKLDRIVDEMQPASSEFDERYKAEVMGELLERLDINAILKEARTNGVSRSDARISEALANAEKARQLQDDILSNISTADSDAWKTFGSFDHLDVARFIKRAAPLLGIDVEKGSSEERFTVRLPDALRHRFSEFGGKTVIEVTTKRRSMARDWRSLVLLDFSSSFVEWTLKQTMAPDFGGGYAVTVSDVGDAKLTMACSALYQNDQGDPRGEELLVAQQKADGSLSVDNRILQSLFTQPLEDGLRSESFSDPAGDAAQALFDRIEAAVADRCNKFLHPRLVEPVALLERGNSRSA